MWNNVNPANWKTVEAQVAGACVAVMLAAGCCCGGHERRISALEEEVAALRQKIAAPDKSPAAPAESVWPRDSYNYLAIGNSLTLHGVCGYWWNRIGMAASDADHDYFHLVQKGLQRKFGKVTARVVEFSVWELNGHDRDQTLSRLDPVLDPNVSLVTIQLGENVADFKTLAEDYVALIRYIGKKTGGKAQIIVIGDFWKDETVRGAAAAKCGADYVSLKAIHNDPKYRSRIGAVVFDAEGNRHVVEHSGVAAHPGDEGMAFIAAEVLEKVRK